MPALKTYDIFISHSWDYDEDYHRLVKMLSQAPYFNWRNYSVPEDDRLNAETELGLTRALYRQMRPVNLVVILAGMYAHHRQWILKEIEIAQEVGKPSIGIRPRGAERVPEVVQWAAKEMVGWNTDSIVSAIRKWAL